MNSWQMAQKVKQEQKKAQDYQNALQAAVTHYQREMAIQKNNIISAFVTKELGTETFDMEAVAQRGSIITYPDGVEEFVWDGVKRIRFFAPQIRYGKLVADFARIYEPVPAQEEPEAGVDFVDYEDDEYES